VRRDVDVEVNGKRFGVTVWVPESQVGATVAAGGAAKVAPRPRRSGGSSAAAAGSGSVTVPMQGTIVKVLVSAGDAVDEGQTVCVLEAMKMENNIAADKSGTVKEVKVEAGQSVGSGDVVVVID
jgi:acetyl-CoA/propionyl-CoA carboxylase biotin carboxyl carrier protein